MSAADPRLTPENRQLLSFDYRAGDRPDRDRLDAIERVLRQVSAPVGTSLCGEVQYALDIIDRLATPPTDEDIEDLFWSLQNILDMPYGPQTA